MMKKQIALVALLFLGMSCFDASAQYKQSPYRMPTSLP